MTVSNYTQFHLLLLDYMDRALKLIRPSSDDSKDAVWFMVKYQKKLGLTFPKNFPILEPTKSRKLRESETEPSEDQVWTTGIRAKRYDKAIAVVKMGLAAAEATKPKPLAFFRNMEYFREQAELDKIDAQILTFFAAARNDDFFSRFFLR